MFGWLVTRILSPIRAPCPLPQIISLGIGDTTEPLPKYIADAMAKAAAGLATREGYSGWVRGTGKQRVRVWCGG